MPQAGMRWRHLIFNTKGTWLHGDQRGFRNRRHRIHSSGDYKHPPPRGEHANLLLYMKDRSSGEVTIPYASRAVIGRAIVGYLQSMGLRVLAVAIAKVHGHALVELKDDIRVVKFFMGELKRKSSRAVKKELPGSVWSAGGQPEPVDTPSHLRAAHDYIIYDQGAGAWTWSYKDATLDGVYARQRPAQL